MIQMKERNEDLKYLKEKYDNKNETFKFNS